MNENLDCDLRYTWLVVEQVQEDNGMLSKDFVEYDEVLSKELGDWAVDDSEDRNLRSSWSG